ncbi:MAG: protein-glutamate O-methyltransferase [Candidatus Delongbacteria bacterium]|nr:protein-glutamate O-methyltransferase [Candidatus Delongbacteria bacterium]
MVANENRNMNEMDLRDVDFNKLAGFIYNNYGIKLPQSKKVMLEGRLRKRLRALKMHSFAEYCDYVFSPAGSEEEVIHMIDVVTTNKTDFFREPAHYDYLISLALPELVVSYGCGINRPLMVWSAGCSSGEEPYTLAMVLNKYAEQYPGFTFESIILATDVSTQMLDRAKRAIYDESRIEPIPDPFRKKYILKSKDPNRQLIRISPEIRAMVRFRRLNLMDQDFGFREPLDVIFCRNVIIYFDTPTQNTLLNKYYKLLRPGGYLFIGHSETLHALDVPFIQTAPTIYKKEDKNLNS